MKYEISVAIPAYNRAEYLKETLDSVLNQSYPAAEIIVVDDGSTDHTPEVLAYYRKSVKSLRIDNAGACVARKIAAEATGSPWLAFCDSDDLWLPNHLERRVELLEKHPEANFSFSDMTPFGPAALPDRTYFSDAPDGWWQQFGSPDQDNCLTMGNNAYLPFLAFNPAPPSPTVMSRELYDKIGGIDPRYARMVAEDADMTRKAILHGHVLCDLTVTTLQRRHEGNLSAIVLKNLLGKCQILENHINLAVAPESFHHEIKKAIDATLHDAFLAAYYDEDKKTMKDIAIKLGFSRLSIKDQLRFIVLFLRTTF